MKKLFVLLFLFNAFLFQAQNHKIEKIIPAHQLNIGSVHTICDDINIPQSDFINLNSSCNIEFGTNDKDFSKVKYEQKYKCNIVLDVAVQNTVDPNCSNGNFGPYTSQITLTIDHDNLTENIELNDLVKQRFGDARRLKIRVVSITYTGDVPVTFQRAIYLKLSYECDRYFTLKNTNLNVSNELINYSGLDENIIGVNSLTSNGASELKVKWDYSGYKPEYYEIEWSWIDNYDENSITNKLNKNQINLTEQQFVNNSTRVQTSNLFYKIPLIFNKGYLIYRVRPVGRYISSLQDANNLYFGAWSTPNSMNFKTVDDWTHVLEIDIPHENAEKNWQYQASYAEEGKKKDVISYFDGSLRNRQTVTKINSTERAIIGENIYDTQGRPAVEILPAPVKNSTLKYYDNFNLNINNDVYSHHDFDWEKEGVCVGDVSIVDSNTKLSTASGTSNYYSELNPDLTIGMNKFIPDANGFPFSRTIFTPDNTGRIRKKSGVGENHQIGSGHEMLYYYGVPTQDELNKLFGYKVGYANKYKKNLVVDPNKQISISYLDPQGRTVATALAGVSPNSLVELSPLNTPVVTSNILENNIPSSSGYFGVNNDQINFNKSILYTKDDNVSEPSSLKFHYKLDKSHSVYTAPCINKNYPFVYRGSISLKDDCGIEKIINDGVSNFRIGTFSLANSSDSSLFFNTFNDINISPLKKGSYYLNKRLEVDKNVLNSYLIDFTNNITTNASCFENLIANNVEELQLNCNTTCESCEKSLVKNYLNESELSNFSDDDSEVTAIEASVRQPLIEKAKAKYIKEKLELLFPGITFVINANIVSVDSSTPVTSEQQVQINLNIGLYGTEFTNILNACRDLCPNDYNVCNVNLEQLLADVSPMGQYGEIPSMSEGANADVVIADIDGPEGEEEESSEVVVNPESEITAPPVTANFNDFPLSVFNEENNLPNNAVVENGICSSTPSVKKSNWRNPYNPFNSGHNYYEEDQITLSKVYLTNKDSVYTPAINDNVTIMTDSEGEYVYPENLKNVEDFIKKWKPSWAKSLIAYHPEYFYYLYNKNICETLYSGINSDSFDQKYQKILETEDYEDKLALFTEFYSKIYSLEDPYFKLNYSNIEIDNSYNIRNNLLNEVLTSNYNGFKVKPLNTLYKLNLVESAYYFAKYKNGFNSPTIIDNDLDQVTNVSTSPSVNLEYYLNRLDTFEKRNSFINNFTMNYFGFKNNIKSILIEVYVNKNNGSNSCIGNAADSPHFNMIFLNQEDNTRNAINNLISNSLIVNSPTGFCTDVCANSNINTLGTKAKRFIPVTYGNSSGLPPMQGFQAANNDAYTSYYTQTGMCPRMLDLDTFLNGLTYKQNVTGTPAVEYLYKSINTDGIPLSEFDYLSSHLLREIDPNAFVTKYYNVTTGQFITSNIAGATEIVQEYYQYNYDYDLKIKSTVNTSNNKILNIKIGNIENAISLKIEDYSHPCYPGSNLNWNNVSFNNAKLVSIKNFVPGSYDSPSQRYNFTAVAVFKRISGNNPDCTFPEEVIISGSILKAQIAGCQFDMPNSSLTSSSHSEAGTGCKNRVDFEKALVKLMNELRNVNRMNVPCFSNLYNPNLISLSADTYSYKGSILPEILKDDILNIDEDTPSSNIPDTYWHLNNSLSPSKFELVYKSNSITKYLHIDFDPDLDRCGIYPLTSEIKSIQINDEITTNDYFDITLYYLENNVLKQAKGKITKVDFDCICSEKVFLPKHNAEIAFEKLLNHLWTKKISHYINVGTNPAFNSPLDQAIVDNALTYIDGSGNFIENFHTVEFGSGTRYGVFFNMGQHRGPWGDNGSVIVNCGLGLILDGINDKSADETNFIEKVYKFTNFKILNKNPNGTYNFSVDVHYNAYTESIGGGVKGGSSNVTTYPAGVKTFEGEISCLNLECSEYNGLTNSLATMLMNIISNPSGITPQGISDYSTLLPTPEGQNASDNTLTNLNFSSTEQGGTKIRFNFAQQPQCEVSFIIPDVLASDITLISNIQFDEHLNNFTADVFFGRSNKIKATGYASCLELPNCFGEVEVPCETCIPKPLEALSCLDEWNNFDTAIQNDNIIVLNFINYVRNSNINADNTINTTQFLTENKNELINLFCNFNYKYIAKEYIKYLNAFGLNVNTHTLEDLNNFPQFITLTEFANTQLNVTSQHIEDALNEYVIYYNSNPSLNYLTWNEFVDQKYVKETDLCPTLPLPISVDIDQSGIIEPCDRFYQNLFDTYSYELKALKIEEFRRTFVKEYLEQALENISETFTKTSAEGEYQYTLYYYDQAGNLIQTVPPAGVKKYGEGDNPVYDATLELQINNTRNNPNVSNCINCSPDHKLTTEYKYNTLNQLVWQKTPDGGITKFAYDKLGRIIASQNAKQAIEISKGDYVFSFTSYDEIGRIREAGEFTTKENISINSDGRLVDSLGNVLELNLEDYESLSRYPYQFNVVVKEATVTTYDELSNTDIINSFSQYKEDHAFKRVTSVLYFDQYNPSVSLKNYNNGIFYDYDIHGNVKELIFDNADPNLKSLNQNRKKVVYEYDLISGNVNKVIYQPNVVNEQFIHKYTYDADNRIVDVHTSKDNVIYEKDAHYEYYLHGPLAKTIIGDKEVQEQNYLYTLQGWLKAVNSERIGPMFDAGSNGLSQNSNVSNPAVDAFGFALNYFNGDYSAIGRNLITNLEKNVFNYTKSTSHNFSIPNSDLFNGNIKEMITSTLGVNQIVPNNFSLNPTQYNYYKYDQLNRISSMTSKSIGNEINTFAFDNPIDSYNRKYTYDPNGNISSMERNDWKIISLPSVTPVVEDVRPMDKLVYKYIDGTNKLRRVTDDVPSNSFSVDLDNQSEIHNYEYDEIGQLTKDKSENIAEIKWRVDGKVKSVLKTNGALIDFKYDGLGNRISKTNSYKGETTTTYYFRDAQGNPLSVYDFSDNTLSLAENHIYGSSRLGLEKRNEVLGSIVLGLDKNSEQARTSQPVVVEEFSLAPSVNVKGGLDFTGPPNTRTAHFTNPYSKINFNYPGEELTEDLEVSANFRIFDNVLSNGENVIISNQDYLLLNLQDNYYPDIRNFYNSVFRIIVQKNTIDNQILYVPILEVESYYRNTREFQSPNWGPRRFRKTYWQYSNLINRKRYILNKGIPENEWNINVKLFAKPNSPDYFISMVLNGNVYKFENYLDKSKNDFTLIDAPHISHSKRVRISNPFPYPFIENNKLGTYKKTYGNAYGNEIIRNFEGLPANICDFSYTVNKDGKDEEDPTFMHTFSFDKLSAAEARKVDNYDATENNLYLNFAPGIFNNINTSYCGTGLLDSDGDGINDYRPDGITPLDTCPFTPNADNQLDSDGDGVGDVCDNCPNFSNSIKVYLNPDNVSTSAYYYTQLDSDEDGVGDACDNCPQRYNPRIAQYTDLNNPSLITGYAQVDSDGDGKGDICDLCPNIPNTGVDLDSNGNGIGDACEGIDQGVGIAVTGVNNGLFTRKVGDKNYELSNHLGNVLSVVTDRKLLLDSYKFDKGNFLLMPDVIAYNDYDPFGMLVPNRHEASTAPANSYRYGFNGKENDREIKGEGNSYDFGARMFDPRVGRWFAPDILENKYPSWSTYNYTMDNPINFIDPDGKAVAAPPRNGIAQFIDNSGVYFWNTEKRTYEHYKYTDSSRQSYSFSGYYRATAKSKVVGKATVIQNVQGEHKITEPTFTEKLADFGHSMSDNLRSMEGNGTIKGAGFKLKGEIGVNKYSIAFDLGTYSSQENTVGGYSKFTINKREEDISAGTRDGMGAVTTKLFSFLPKFDVGVYGYVNTKTALSMSLDPTVVETTQLQLGTFKVASNSKGESSLGFNLFSTSWFSKLIPSKMNPGDKVNVNQTTQTPIESLTGSTKEINLNN